MGRSLIQRSPTDYGVSERDRDTSTMKKSRPTGGLSNHKMKK